MCDVLTKCLRLYMQCEKVFCSHEAKALKCLNIWKRKRKGIKALSEQRENSSVGHISGEQRRKHLNSRVCESELLDMTGLTMF